VKLTPGVIFINVKRANFSYKRFVSAAFFLLHVHKKTAETTFVRKIRTFNVDEIDTWCRKLRRMILDEPLNGSIIKSYDIYRIFHRAFYRFAYLDKLNSPHGDLILGSSQFS
jgi:hypothetical protein